MCVSGRQRTPHWWEKLNELIVIWSERISVWALQWPVCSLQLDDFNILIFRPRPKEKKKIIKEKRNKLRTWFALRSSVVIILTISVHCFVWHKAYFSSLAVCLTSAGWPFPLLRLLPRSEEVMRTGCTIQFLSTTF